MVSSLQLPLSVARGESQLEPGGSYRQSWRRVVLGGP